MVVPSHRYAGRKGALVATRRQSDSLLDRQRGSTPAPRSQAECTHRAANDAKHNRSYAHQRLGEASSAHRPVLTKVQGAAYKALPWLYSVGDVARGAGTRYAPCHRTHPAQSQLTLRHKDAAGRRLVLLAAQVAGYAATA